MDSSKQIKLRANTFPPLPAGLVTGIGSLPFRDADDAVRFVAEQCPRLPFWPQLPLRHIGEGVIAQGLGSLANFLEPDNNSFCWKIPTRNLDTFKDRLTEETPGLNPNTARGFFAFKEAVKNERFPHALLLKAQMEGPITLAHCLYSQGMSLAGNRELLPRITSFIARQAIWQIRRLQASGKPILFVFDEPVLGLALTEVSPLKPAEIEEILRSVLQAVKDAGALVGIHCCSTLPLKLLSKLNLDLLSFDAFQANTGYDWCRLVRTMLANSGVLAFGLIPLETASNTMQDRESYYQHWFKLMAVSGEIAPVARRSIVTATCGLGLQSPWSAATSFAHCRAVADRIAQMSAQCDAEISGIGAQPNPF